MLQEYNKKRDFKQTSEPKGTAGKGKPSEALSFVVQRHDATRLHYDFRLELGKVLVSWAVPKGPSMNPKDKRLAVHVEDHPLDYQTFYGTIPEGNYGAGEVQIWDNGAYFPIDEEHQKITEAQAIKNLDKGELKVMLAGTKLKGEFVLVRLKQDDKNWLLIKHKDEYAVDKYDSEDETSIKIKSKSPAKKQASKAKELSEKEAPVKKKSSAKAPEAPVAKNVKKKPSKDFQIIKPMLAHTGTGAFDDAAWLFETKWDGYRTVAEKIGNNVTIYSRNALSFDSKYPAILEAVRSSINHDVILDGEVVAMVNGKPSFQALQHAEDSKPQLIYAIFDLLELDGQSTMELPLIDRKKLLEQLLQKANNPILIYSGHIIENGKDYFEKVVGQAYEGIMAKKMDSTYAPGARTHEWLKIKNVNDREAIIVGFTEPRGSRRYFGALILAEKDGEKYRYIGHTGTGFGSDTLKETYQQLAPLITEQSPFDKKIKVNAPVTWLQPKLVCTINFTEQTEGGMLRHPVFTGLRTDKTINEVTTENNKPMAHETTTTADKETDEKDVNQNSLLINKKKIPVTNLGKIYFPEKKLTKGDIIAYYHTIAPYILPYLKNRPLSLKRMPDGIHGQSFYHKNAGEKVPSWIKTYEMYSEAAERDITYIVVNNAETLIHVANLGSVEMNPWNSTILKPENPTWLVIDIDPADDNTFEQVIETALAVKEVTDRAGLTSYCKTSGASGLHVYIPLGGKHDYDFVKGLAEILASLTHDLVPDFTSLERNLKKRGQKIYVDFLQNRRGQTLASAYSLRPVVAASVSTPLEWKEVKKGLHPSQFDIFNIQERLDKVGDLFARVLTEKNDVKKALKILEGK